MKRAVLRVAMVGVVITLVELFGCARVQEAMQEQRPTIPAPPRQPPSTAEKRGNTAPGVPQPAPQPNQRAGEPAPPPNAAVVALLDTADQRARPATWITPRLSSNAPCVLSRRILCCGTVWRQCACSKGSSLRQPVSPPNQMPWQAATGSFRSAIGTPSPRPKNSSAMRLPPMPPGKRRARCDSCNTTWLAEPSTDQCITAGCPTTSRANTPTACTSSTSEISPDATRAFSSGEQAARKASGLRSPNTAHALAARSNSMNSDFSCSASSFLMSGCNMRSPRTDEAMRPNSPHTSIRRIAWERDSSFSSWGIG